MGDYYCYEGSQKNTNTSEIGYAVVEFTYTSNNVMRNCTVSEARNRTGNYIHGVYIANNSCGNRIYKNKFYHIKPDPIRIRNGSNDNKIHANNFINTGVYAYVSDWYNGSVGEKKSYGNLVYKNKFYGKYNDSKKEFLSLDQIAIFYSKQSKKDKADTSRLKATQNVVIKSKNDKNYNKNVFIY